MDINQLIKDKKLVIFELDDVLFPAKDYLLQVYYLFAQFIEYAEQKSAQHILDFMRTEYESFGSENLFEKTATKFELAKAYQHNFDLLHENARLPLKLLLFKNMLNFLQELVVNRVSINIIAPSIMLVKTVGLEKYFFILIL